MADETKPLEVEPEIADADVVRMGAVLNEFVQLEGWAIFKALQQQAANDIGRKFLKDEAFSKREARGYLNATEAAVQRVERLVERYKQHTQDAAESRDHDDEIFSRPVTGSLAGEQ